MQGQACHPDLPTGETHHATLGTRINQSMTWMGGQSYKRTKIYGIYPDRSHFIPVSVTIVYALTTHCARLCIRTIRICMTREAVGSRSQVLQYLALRPGCPIGGPRLQAENTYGGNDVRVLCPLT